MALVEVCGIAELFEAVLLQLPLRDLLLSQRVCHHWRSTITNSPALQQRLFFQPISHSAEPELNPLLREVFPQFFILEEVPGTMDFEPGITDIIKKMPWHQNASRRRNVLSQKASWRQMFPIQPPARIESVARQGSCRCWPVYEKGWVQKGFWRQEDDGGIRMGGLWDLVIHVVDGMRDGAFFIEWVGVPVMAQDEEMKSRLRNTRDEVEAEGENEHEDEDEERVIVRDAANGWRVVPARRNVIIIHNEYNSLDCHPEPPILCGLSIVELDEGIIQYEEEVY